MPSAARSVWEKLRNVVAGRRVAVAIGGASLAILMAHRDPVGSCGERLQPGPACRLELQVADRERLARVRIPDLPAPPSGYPLIIALPGEKASADWQVAYTGFEDAAVLASFVAVHADGSGADRSWNTGTCCGTAAKHQIDDVGFLVALIHDVTSRVAIDPNRVHAVGMASGGSMIHRLACERSNLLASLALVSALPSDIDCDRAIPVSTLIVHGVRDPVVRLDDSLSASASAPQRSPDLEAHFAAQAARWGCAQPIDERRPSTPSGCRVWTSCKLDVEIELCTLADGGHTWPGAQLELPALGPTSRSYDANREILRFLAHHPAPKR